MTDSTILSEITVSLEWAKKLKEAGWPQEHACFFWRGPSPHHGRPEWNIGECVDTHTNEGCFAAPTAEEILRRLPPSMLHRNRRDMFRIQIRKTPRQHWQIGYATSKADWTFKEGIAAMQEADTLANAAAAMWVYLKENNLLPTISK